MRGENGREYPFWEIELPLLSIEERQTMVR